MENEDTSIKCLMFGQMGVGKTTFLKNFPNSKLVEPPPGTAATSKELYSIDYLDSKFETHRVQVQNCDISLETCMHDADLLVKNKHLTPITACSNQFINISQFKIIIMCFAMDDVNSFELVKSKWEIDLKRNKSNAHCFLLVGFKSDLTTPSNQKSKKQQPSNSNTKIRSSSVNSNSSTSKLQLKFKKRERLHSSTYESTSVAQHKCHLKMYKHFARQIGSCSFLQISNVCEPVGNKKKINTYEKFILSVAKKHELISKRQCKPKKTFNIVKSISSPIGFIKSKKSPSLIKVNEQEQEHVALDNASLTKAHENTSFIVCNNLEDATSNNKADPSGSEKQPTTKQLASDLSIRDKLSRLAFGIGTYLVTCGSSQSRKLADLKQYKHKNTLSNNKIVRRNKSWLLLASEVSLNNADNDDVFN